MPYSEIIAICRIPGKIYIPIDFGGKTVSLVSVEKKDLIEVLQANFMAKSPKYVISGPYMDGTCLKKVNHE